MPILTGERKANHEVYQYILIQLPYNILLTIIYFGNEVHKCKNLEPIDILTNTPNVLSTLLGVQEQFH